jgi:hypothetical protein
MEEIMPPTIRTLGIEARAVDDEPGNVVRDQHRRASVGGCDGGFSDGSFDVVALRGIAESVAGYEVPTNSILI